ncbi:YfhO family protein [Pedobacter sp. MC2016-14]|uniref:YfhO family protein n=1 Tax=Pedobacter sp. MC2016-14 TaxID=2897327 RepID=UPI001E3BAD13|nr:YfhO family protein [Pedobacter sp. MC2016-14]MCD0487554.1 YfhO family protein [Pedobacter sp. MC2016-14]
MNTWFKRNGIHLAIIAFFVIICFVYFSPVIQGKAPAQSDVLQAKAMQKEIMDYKAKDGKGPLWTNQMFGGMPTYQIWAQYPMNIAGHVISFVKIVLPDPVDTVLLYLLGAYLLFCVLKVNPYLAAAGAIAFAFTSYNFIIIAAGHSNKALAIAFCAPIIASVILTLRGKYWLGGSLLALFMALEIRSNHIQMTYYLFIALLIYIGIEIYNAIKEKRFAAFGKSLSFLAAGAVIALMVNAGTLWTTYEYGKESNRGNSNLTSDAAEEKNGLSKEYAYGWSQGVGECFTFLIPNLYGGATSIDALVKPESHTYVALQSVIGGDPTQAIQQLAGQVGFQQYWGEKPGTSGPYYFGAIICFLFVFGLLVVRSRLKWWILATTILFLLLSFGKNFPFVSDIFFAYFPLYNKFRAVESILAITGLMVPLLAILAVKEALESGYDQKTLVKKLTISAGITGGFSLLVAIMPTVFFSFSSAMHTQMTDALTQMLQNNRGAAQNIANALIADRADVAKADAWRSFFFIAVAYALVWAYLTKKMNAQMVFILLGLVVLIDMWQVDRRYLNNSNFASKADLNNHFQARDVDTFILADKDPDFRVLDLTISTFSDASASQFHKTVGGYHAAKLKRYQELIDKQFSKSINQDVLDMLNTKYIITQDQQNGSYKMQRNATAAGNAWFVQSVQFAQNADQEMKAISSFDPKQEAIIDVKYKSLIDDKKVGVAGPTASIKLESYHPDHLVYDYSTPNAAIAVFSEIFYDKGWNMYIDGIEKPYFRADYVLRAAQLEAGNHKVEFKFEPVSYYMGEKISLLGSILLMGAIGFAFYTENKKKAA